jgi:hypothetical protein
MYGETLPVLWGVTLPLGFHELNSVQPAARLYRGLLSNPPV